MYLVRKCVSGAILANRLALFLLLSLDWCIRGHRPRRVGCFGLLQLREVFGWCSRRLVPVWRVHDGELGYRRDSEVSSSKGALLSRLGSVLRQPPRREEGGLRTDKPEELREGISTRIR